MDSRILVGVDLGGTNLRVGRVESGRVIAHAVRATLSKASAEIVLEDLCVAISEVITSDTAAIGIGAPSVVDVERGIVFTVENIPTWKEVHLKDILEKRFGIPVYVNNDANCFAVGEFYFGLGQGFRHLVGITVGTGLGAGIILNGQLYSGANCGAGEIGAIPYRDQTFEYFASGQVFLRDHGVNGATLHAQALQGDAKALKIFSDFGEDFGNVILTILCAYDPEIIILGGSVAKAFPLFEKSMRNVLTAFAYQRALQRLQVQVSENPQIAILGAAALGLDALA